MSSTEIIRIPILPLGMLVTKGMTLGVNLGYDDVKLNHTEYAGADVILAEKGQRIGGAPFVAAVSGDYDVPLNDRLRGYTHFDYTFRSRSPSTAPPRLHLRSGHARRGRERFPHPSRIYEAQEFSS